MGKIKYLRDIENLFKKSPVVNSDSLKIIIRNKNKKIKSYLKQLIRNLILKGKIKRLAKGYYTIFDDPILIVFCIKPSYLGLQNALSFHNFWEQETIPILITTRKVRQGLRKIFGINVLIRRINKKYFFGFNYYNENDFYLPYSDIEKTLIDLVYFKEKLNKETLENIRKNIDGEKLNYYLKFYPKKFRNLVLKLLRY